MQLDPEVAKTLSQSVVKNMKSSLIAPAINPVANNNMPSEEKSDNENV